MEANCAVCGKVVIRSPSQMKRSERSGPFCGRACRALFVKMQTSSDLNAICSFCGVEFHTSPSKAKTRRLLYCCREHWKLGIQSEGRVYYTKFKKSLCEKCGFIPVHKCQLDIHHINGDRKDNSPGNLLTICANCHRIVSREENLRRNKVINNMYIISKEKEDQNAFEKRKG